LICISFVFQDREGNLAPGAIANLVDEIGGLVIYREGLPMNASISMSISYVSTAKVDVSMPSFLLLYVIDCNLFCLQVKFTSA
jgi:hypothetical protein